MHEKLWKTNAKSMHFILAICPIQYHYTWRIHKEILLVNRLPIIKFAGKITVLLRLSSTCRKLNALFFSLISFENIASLSLNYPPQYLVQFNKINSCTWNQTTNNLKIRWLTNFTYLTLFNVPYYVLFSY